MEENQQHEYYILAAYEESEFMRAIYMNAFEEGRLVDGVICQIYARFYLS